MFGFALSHTSVAILGASRGMPIPPAGYRLLTETVSGVRYFLTESIGGTTCYLMEAM